MSVRSAENSIFLPAPIGGGNLFSTLTNGDDGHGLDIQNIDALDANGLISCLNLNATADIACLNVNASADVMCVDLNSQTVNTISNIVCGGNVSCPAGGVAVSGTVYCQSVSSTANILVGTSLTAVGAITGGSFASAGGLVCSTVNAPQGVDTRSVSILDANLDVNKFTTIQQLGADMVVYNHATSGGIDFKTEDATGAQIAGVRCTALGTLMQGPVPVILTYNNELRFNNTSGATHSTINQFDATTLLITAPTCAFTGGLSIPNIPTSNAGLPAGSVWSNAGVLTIV